MGDSTRTGCSSFSTSSGSGSGATGRRTGSTAAMPAAVGLPIVSRQGAKTSVRTTISDAPARIRAHVRNVIATPLPGSATRQHFARWRSHDGAVRIGRAFLKPLGISSGGHSQESFALDESGGG